MLFTRRRQAAWTALSDADLPSEAHRRERWLKRGVGQEYLATHEACQPDQE